MRKPAQSVLKTSKDCLMRFAQQFQPACMPKLAVIKDLRGSWLNCFSTLWQDANYLDHSLSRKLTLQILTFNHDLRVFGYSRMDFTWTVPGMCSVCLKYCLSCKGMPGANHCQEDIEDNKAINICIQQQLESNCIWLVHLAKTICMYVAYLRTRNGSSGFCVY